MRALKGGVGGGVRGLRGFAELWLRGELSCFDGVDGEFMSERDCTYGRLDVEKLPRLRAVAVGFVFESADESDVTLD